MPDLTGRASRLPEADATAAFRLTPENAASYLRGRRLLGPDVDPEVRVLSGGISNIVLMVSWAEGALVVKQSLPQLLVEEVWEFDPSRIIVEAKCMRALGEILEDGEVPRVLDCDNDRFVFTMTAAAPGGYVWKGALLDGVVESEVARKAGDLLGRIHRKTADNRPLATTFDDLMPLIQGRVDPYHWTAVLANPDLARLIDRDIERLTTKRRTLVLGDYSPKNLIVYPDHVLALDFEVAHWGDPAFDTGFMLTHLVGKAIHNPERKGELLDAARAFFSAYQSAAGEAGATEADSATELGVLMLCRVDGKSKLEYLDEHQRVLLKRLAREVITSEEPELELIFASTERLLTPSGQLQS